MPLSFEQLKSLLKKLAPLTSAAKRDRFIPYLLEAMPRYEINSPKRIAAFIATCCFESDYFKATEEYADGWAYDKSINPKKAKALGNTEKGDGPRFKGRSLIQTTGRANYAELTKHRDTFSAHLGPVPDFILAPEQLAKPVWAVESACYFWQTHKLNSYADIHDFFAIQGIVNRGNPEKKAKDYPAREALYTTAYSYLQSLTPATPAPPSPEKSIQQNMDVAPTPSPEIFNNDSDSKVKVSVIGKLSSLVTWLQGLTERSATIETSVSKSSWATKILGWIFAIVLSAFGIIKDNPVETIVGGLVVIAVIWFWHHAKSRQNSRLVMVTAKQIVQERRK